MNNLYQVCFYTHSGMLIPLKEHLTKDEVRVYIKTRNKLARKRKQPVVRIAKNKWEYLEEEDCGMIGDRHGILLFKVQK